MTLFSSWSFAPLHFIHYLFFAACFMLLVFIGIRVFRRYQNQSKLKASLVYFINIIAVASLLLLVMPIVQLKPSIEDAILITNHSDEQLLQQAIIQGKQKGIEKVYLLVTDESQRESLFNYVKKKHVDLDIIWLSSSYPLFDPRYHWRHIYVYGDGLTKEQLKRFKDELAETRISFIPSKLTLGVIEAKWSKDVLLGESASFEGKLQSDQTNRLYQVELLDINQDVLAKDTVRTNEKFTFNFIPKVLGANEYYLSIFDTKTHQVLVKETIALNVFTSPPINVLVKTASPSFEIRHLKNWLAEQASQLTIISQTSQHTFLTQNVNNEPPINSNYFTSEGLANVDLLMLDGRTIATLSFSEQDAIIEAIHQGLGLFVFVDNDLVKGVKKNKLIDLIEEFTAFENKSESKQNKSTTIHFPNSDNTGTLIPSNINLVNRLGQPLVVNDEQQPLVLSHQLGFGSLTLSTINKSFQWKLRGLEQGYGQYWQFIIGKIINSNQNIYWLEQADTMVVLPLQHSELCYVNKEGRVHVSHQRISSETVHDESPMTINKMIGREFHYCSDWFATESGWYRFTLLDEATMQEQSKPQRVKYLYVSEPKQWQAWQQYAKQQATKNYVAEQQHSKPDAASSTGTQKSKITRLAINKLPIWLVFLFSCTLLWLERKSV
ncbi:hypothetical protein ACOYR1_10820 [Thalassotalea piscium]